MTAVCVMIVEVFGPLAVSRHAYADSCQTNHACLEANAIYCDESCDESCVETANDEPWTEIAHDHCLFGPTPATTRLPLYDCAYEVLTYLSALVYFDDVNYDAGILFGAMWLALRSVACLELQTACEFWKVEDGGTSRQKATDGAEMRL